LPQSFSRGLSKLGSNDSRNYFQRDLYGSFMTRIISISSQLACNQKLSWVWDITHTDITHLTHFPLPAITENNAKQRTVFLRNFCAHILKTSLAQILIEFQAASIWCATGVSKFRVRWSPLNIKKFRGNPPPPHVPIVVFADSVKWENTRWQKPVMNSTLS
jgi:hypothetical protein